MMKKIVIHLGFHKTASTSIQLTCDKNRDILQNNNYHYGDFRFIGRQCENHSVPFYFLFSNDYERYHVNMRYGLDAKRERELFREQLKENLCHSGVLLISGEDISNLKEDGFEALKSFFESNGYEIETIAFIRSPLETVTSMTQQVIRGGGVYQPNFRYLVRGYSDKIRRIRNSFPDTRFFSFSEAVKHRYGPVGFFFDQLEIKDLISINIVTANESISRNAAYLIAHINRQQPFFVDGKISPLRAIRDTVAFHHISGPRFLLRRKEVERNLDLIEKQNNWLGENLGEEFCDTELRYAEDDNTWSDENIAELGECLNSAPAHLLPHACSYFDTTKGLSEKKRHQIRCLFVAARP